MESNKLRYSFLVVGKAGGGKSALAKLLTGDESIVSRNSKGSITKQICYHKCLDVAT